MASWESGDVQDTDAARQAAEVAVELSEQEQAPDPRRLVRALRGVARSANRVAGSARRGAGTAGRGAASLLNWLTAQVVAMGPRLRVRDQATLRAQFPGRSDEEIGELLIDHAARAAMAVGGATGAWAALPVLPAFPAEVAAETLAVVGIELKLVAELHEAYGVSGHRQLRRAGARVPGGLGAPARLLQVPGGLLLAAGSPLARQLRRRLLARVRRSTFSLAPLFTGAIIGATLNRREMRRLGRDIVADLRRGPVVRAEAVGRPPLTGPRD